MLRFYARPGPLTSPGKHARLFEELPADLPALVRIVQGLVIHEFVASDFYDVTIPQRRKGETHLRGVEQMLDALLALRSDRRAHASA